MNNTIILKSANKLTRAYLCPHKIPGTMRYPDCVRRVNKDQEMILSREDIDSGKYFIAETDVVEIWDGKTFNLDEEIEAAQWEAIKYHKIIAKARDERDENGDLVIDGNSRKYGVAEWYVVIPGADATNKNESRRKKIEAQNYVIADTPEDRLLKARVLGKSMRGAHDSDVEDYLMQEAERNPTKIINLYTGGDMKLRLLFLKAKDDKIIVLKDNLLMYGDVVLGSTDESAIIWMKQSANKKLLKIIEQEAYPEFSTQTKV